jgi:nucleoside-diphosphate-sugar epimerase
VVTVTGSSGFLGRLLRDGLEARGFRVLPFDRLRGPLVSLLRRSYFGTSTSRRWIWRARRIKGLLRRAESGLVRAAVLRPTCDDILDLRGRLVERFRGSEAVIHLAALPHPNVPGAVEADFRRINYDGAINVFEAAREAGVPRFIFASSAQVYAINRPVRIDSFPILESNYCPTLAEGQSAYGFFKREFERYLEAACAGGGTRAVALRLECPGLRSRDASNFYVSTSIENTVAAFVRTLDADLAASFESFNVADAEVEPAIVDVQRFLRERWPDVPNQTQGNECLLGTERARRILGYTPARGGTYHDLAVLF